MIKLGYLDTQAPIVAPTTPVRKPYASTAAAMCFGEAPCEAMSGQSWKSTRSTTSPDADRYCALLPDRITQASMMVALFVLGAHHRN